MEPVFEQAGGPSPEVKAIMEPWRTGIYPRRENLPGPLVHRDDVPWSEAPRPFVFHRCFAQTQGVIDGTMIRRCPCGGISISFGPWMERNSRRKGD